MPLRSRSSSRSRSLLAALSADDLQVVGRALEILIRAAEQASATVTLRPVSTN